MNVHEIAVVEVEAAPSPMHSHLADMKESMEKKSEFLFQSRTLHNHKSTVNTYAVQRK